MRALAVPLALVVLFANAAAATAPPPAPPPASPPGAASCPPAAVGNAPEQVVVGMYLTQVAAIDVKANTFLGDFYLWFRWRGKIDPTKNFELMNAVESWDLVREAVYKDDAGQPKHEELPDGCHFQQFHVQGRFAHPFQLAAYPLDRQQITIRIEDSRYTIEELQYVADAGTVIDPGLEAPGWQVHGGNGLVVTREYASAMGDPRITRDHQRFSQYRYLVRLSRPLLGYLSKTVLPIGFVLMITLLIFFVSARYFEGRLGLAVTTLISAVALQLTTSADLPQVGYLVLVDKLYNLSYVMILFAMIESAIAVRWHDDGREAAALKLDRWAAIIFVVGAIVTSALILFLGAG